MANRVFASSTGSAPTGTTKYGDLIVGSGEGYDYFNNYGGLNWAPGPDESGYIIATSPLKFYATGSNEADFVSLAERVTGQTFVDGNAAKTWLESNGYWTNFSNSSPSTGDYYLLASYNAASSNGQITFPNHNASTYSLNPNTVGQYGYAIYINQFDSTNNDMVTILDQLLGRNGTLTLTQGSNSVTYSFTDTAFSYGGGYNFQYWWDDAMESSPSGAITVTSAASGNFNNVDPITITIS